MSEDQPHILVVDDDPRLRDLLNRYLTKEGFRITAASDAAEARRRLQQMQFDLLVLDVMMPGESGIELTRDLHRSQAVPILLLTAMDDASDRINGLESGADDYLTKPFEPRELRLRIEAILRRLRTVAQAPATPDIPAMIRLGKYLYDTKRSLLLHEDGEIRLTTTEGMLLAQLAARPGVVLSRETLASGAAGDTPDAGNSDPITARAVDVQVTRLRRKIEPDPRNPRYLQTVRGRGYVLYPD